jgi:hypothetical protein
MMLFKRLLCFVFLSLLLSFAPLPVFGADQIENNSKDEKKASVSQKPVFNPMPDPGKKVPIGDGFYMVYGFNKRPKLGMLIIKVEIFSEQGKKDTSFEVKADSGMPSMSGAHETGEQPFTLSNKGDYLHPINIVMPGDWEIRMTILKQGKVIFRGRYNFDV